MDRKYNCLRWLNIDQQDKQNRWFDQEKENNHMDISHIQLRQVLLRSTQEDKEDIDRIHWNNFQLDNIHKLSMLHWLEFQLHIQHTHIEQLNC